MSNLPVNKKTSDINLIDKDLYSALKNSLYPGAKDESIMMVLSYCSVRGLDPMQKPVHIVPMSVKDAASGRYEMRDIIMPGIGLYRVQAQRSGQYAGQTDPEFGEDITEKLGNVEITYPKWCKIIVSKQMPNGEIATFSAREFWKENYATGGKENPIAPNAMWKKRPYAQLAKCAEAQALRKAFPDVIDQTPSAEEMEGKQFYDLTAEKEKTDTASSIDQLISNKKKSDIENADYVNPETGEIIDHIPTMADKLRKQLETAKSLDTLNLAADLIRDCSPEFQAELTSIFHKRKKEFS